MSATPSQQYCLRWNNYQNNLTNVFDQLLQSEAFVDVTLACDGHYLKAHKMVLSACSPYFQTLFFDNPCTHPIVILKDIKWDELKAVVEFMYRGEINVSQDQLAPLLKVAEVLKIRGLADVSRGGTGNTATATATAQQNNSSNNNNSSSGNIGGGDSDSESSQSIHPRSSSNPIGSSSLAGLLPSSMSSNRHDFLGRKRRKLSITTPEDGTSSPNNGSLSINHTDGDEDRVSTANNNNNNGLMMDTTPGSNASSPSPDVVAALAAVCNSSNSSSPAVSSSNHPLASLPSALLNLHSAAAAAAVAAAAANNNPSTSTSHSGSGGPISSVGVGGSLANDLVDLKPGIVEMIREEERAKMLESSQSWLGGSNTAASSLSDSYQYQIQNLWQKCWSTNQSGMMQTLRFRERGPLKSWRPETMAEAIFAVLKEGLSLSQAARKYDIPYPTFVLYANRVHNMLGPSTDSCTGSDLASDMRPKGRGRPQRILLGSWPEDHIRNVIRAVVFRDTHQLKEDLQPFLFNRDGTMAINQQTVSSASTSGSSSITPNGLDMTLPSPHHLFSLTAAAAAAHMNGSHGRQQTSPNLSELVGNNPLHHVQTQLGSSEASSSIGAGIGAQAQMQLLALQQRHHQLRRTSSDSSQSVGPYGNNSCRKLMESVGDVKVVKIETSEDSPRGTDLESSSNPLMQESDSVHSNNSCDDEDLLDSERCRNNSARTASSVECREIENSPRKESISISSADEVPAFSNDSINDR